MKCLDVLLSVITKIIKISLDTGCFPNDWKEAIILPIFKKSGPESSFDNLRLISNLAYRVMLNGEFSVKYEFNFGVPQGFCLGPLLFIPYNPKLFDIVSNHLPDSHCCADYS